jgi:ABC-type lipoprotein release transport system permease subunit
MLSLLFGTSPFDPVVLAMTVVVLVMTAVLASLIPAWRASRLNPADLLSTD